jgi:hypothetical protein
MNIMTKAAFVAAAAAGTVALPAAVASASTHYPAGHCSAQGGYATCVESGTAYHPRGIYAHVWASPAQRVDVFWNMVCSKGTGAGSSSGSFTASTTVSRWIPHPYAHPDSCTIAVEGSLHRNGNKITVWTNYTR